MKLLIKMAEMMEVAEVVRMSLPSLWVCGGLGQVPTQAPRWLWRGCPITNRFLRFLWEAPN